jgi:histidine triad (HIT) family protein
MSDPTCLFCKIVAGQIPAEVVHRTDDVLAFRDINPAAPTHILVIPIEHISSLAAAEDEHRELLGRIALAARDIAIEEGVSESGYRTVMNTGGDGGQSVHHLHLHLLGGRALSWPAG